jgi:aryl-alcohol dehydrogenase-like predicted oxidoreductase
MYGKGKSEKIIANTFKDMRNEVIYSTKWGYDMYNAKQVGHNEIPQKHNPDYLEYALQQSLERLQTNYIDVYSLHNPKMDAIKNDNLFLSLDSLINNGRIKSHGIALGPAIGWEDEGVMAMEKRNITCLQTVYNILEQDPGRTLLDNAKKYDVGIIVRVPDASGVLTGKVNEKTIFDKNDHRANRKKEWIYEAIKKIEKMTPFLNTKGWDIFQLAIKFILSQKQVSVVLPTITDIEEIEAFAEMSDGHYLNESELAYITELYNNNFFVESVIS